MKRNTAAFFILLCCFWLQLLAQIPEKPNNCISAGGNLLVGLSEINVSLSPSLQVERAITKSLSVYGAALYIGNMPDNYEKRTGIVAGIGIRYYYMQTLLKKPLEGFYIAAQPVVESYEVSYTDSYYPQSYENNTRVIAAGLTAGIGGRWISKSNLSVDVYMGAGILGGNIKNTNRNSSTVFIYHDNRIMGLFNSGISLGYIF